MQSLLLGEREESLKISKGNDDQRVHEWQNQRKELGKEVKYRGKYRKKEKNKRENKRKKKINNKRGRQNGIWKSNRKKSRKAEKQKIPCFSMNSGRKISDIMICDRA